MRNEIPYNIWILTGKDGELEGGFIKTELFCPRTTTKTVMKSRLKKMNARYPSISEFEVVELRNSGFTLELPTQEQYYTNYDTFPLIIHHPDLKEKSYNHLIQFPRYSFINNLLQVRNITGGNLLGTYCFSSDGQIYLENEFDKELEESRGYGELIGDKTKYTKTYIPGHTYYILDGVSTVKKGVYLGKFDVLWDCTSGYVPPKPFSYNSPQRLYREPTHSFRGISVYEKDELYTLDSFFDTGYRGIDYFKDKYRPKVIDLGETKTDFDLQELLIDQDEFFHTCFSLVKFSGTGLISSDYIKNNLEEFKSYLTRNIKELTKYDGSLDTDRLEQLLNNTKVVNLSETEIKNILDYVKSGCN